MTIYCEGAAAAEVLFSLTGGREGRIVSNNPPVEIYFGNGYLVEVEGNYPWDSPIDNSYYRLLFKSFFVEGCQRSESYRHPFYIFELLTPRGEWDLVKHRVKKVWEFPYRPNDITMIKGHPQQITLNNHFAENVFSISDQSGVLYYQQYPEPPTYQVNCKSCPTGLCPVRRYDEIVCIDCKKVIGGINNASQKLDSIYG
jgi:hypothetical protein